jgi:hypothetical protein
MPGRKHLRQLQRVKRLRLCVKQLGLSRNHQFS